MWAIVVLTPVVTLVGAESVLRLAGYGHDLEPLFVPAPQHPEYLQANPRVVARFFTDPSQAPSVSIETTYFRARKAPGTFRVFVQGESSAAGFPYGLGASPAGARAASRQTRPSMRRTCGWRSCTERGARRRFVGRC